MSSGESEFTVNFTKGYRHDEGTRGKKRIWDFRILKSERDFLDFLRFLEIFWDFQERKSGFSGILNPKKSQKTPRNLRKSKKISFGF